jgi:DNA topoisomerase-3
MKIIIAEKPSVGKTIAKFFGATKSGEGCITGDGVAVTWCFGHLLEQAMPEDYDAKYKAWNMDLLPIVPTIWKMNEKDDCKKQIKIIGGLLKGATEIIHAGDPDREGQLLVDEVLERFNCKKPVKRLWLAALDDDSIKKAIGSMKDGKQYHSLKLAAEARARADWLVGLNLTRAWTNHGRKFNHGVLSVGRVQTPTLGMVVKRDLAVESFKSRDFYQVIGSFPFPAKWQPKGTIKLDEEGRLLDRAVAEAISNQVKGKPAKVAKYESKQCSEAAPLPYSLSALQQKASSKYGFSAQEVLDIAQALYETHKVTTYPRTDCRYLPESMHSGADEILKTLDATEADASIKSSAFNDKKITAHHAIVPTGKGSTVSLNDKEKKLYELIRLAYISQFYPEHKFQQVNLSIVIECETFTAAGKTTTQEGWKVIFSGEREDEDEDKEDALPTLPKLAQGDALTCTDAQVAAKKTTPPKYYTDGTLIAAMTNVHKLVDDPEIKKRLKETAGIGTEATRANIIETLLNRKFVDKKGKSLISTKTGRELIKALGQSDVVNVGTTGVFEGYLDEVSQGTLTPEQFLRDVVLNVSREVDLLKGGSAPLMAQGNAPQKDAPVKAKPGNNEKIHHCECGGQMRQKKGPKGVFWGCSNYPECKLTLPDEKGAPGQRRQPATATTGPAHSCPKCKKDLRKLTAKKGANAGKEFWACSGWPTCDFSASDAKGVPAF